MIDAMTQTALILLWRALGLLFLALGLIGIVVPVMPTVPFWLVALWAFGKGHPAWRARLLAHPVYGPSLHVWYEQGAIPRRAKYAAFIGLGFSVALCSFVLHERPIVLAGVLAFLAGSAFFIATRPEPSPVRVKGDSSAAPPPGAGQG